jgi:hypothetical protein
MYITFCSQIFFSKVTVSGDYIGILKGVRDCIGDECFFCRPHTLCGQQKKLSSPIQSTIQVFAIGSLSSDSLFCRVNSPCSRTHRLRSDCKIKVSWILLEVISGRHSADCLNLIKPKRRLATSFR